MDRLKRAFERQAAKDKIEIDSLKASNEARAVKLQVSKDELEVERLFRSRKYQAEVERLHYQRRGKPRPRPIQRQIVEDGKPTAAAEVSPAKSNTSFCSIDGWMRRPSTESCEDPGAFKELPKPGPDDLTNEIHPVFASEYCHGEARQYYDALRPAFQLASRFIQTHSLLPFWWTMIYSDVKELPELWYPKDQKGFEYLTAPEILSPEEISHTEISLRHMAGFIRFTVASPTVQTRDDCWTYMRRSGPDQARIFLARGEFVGLRSAIKIGDERRRTWYLWSLATGIMHEFTHAVRALVRKSPELRDFYFWPGATFSEDGYDWEQQHLGGKTFNADTWTIDPGDPKAGRLAGLDICLTQWPSPTIVGIYVWSRSFIGVREKPNFPGLQRAEVSPRSVWEDFGSVSHWALRKFFQDDFWDEEVTAAGADATRLPFRMEAAKSWCTEGMVSALLGRYQWEEWQEGLRKLGLSWQDRKVRMKGGRKGVKRYPTRRYRAVYERRRKTTESLPEGLKIGVVPARRSSRVHGGSPTGKGNSPVSKRNSPKRRGCSPRVPSDPFPVQVTYGGVTKRRSSRQAERRASASPKSPPGWTPKLPKWRLATES